MSTAVAFRGTWIAQERLGFLLAAKHGVLWFEEPVSSDDLAGLHALRARAPEGMAIAAGEYGYDPFYFRRMLAAGAVDVLQADTTRCGGAIGFLRADALATRTARPCRPTAPRSSTRISRARACAPCTSSTSTIMRHRTVALRRRLGTVRGGLATRRGPAGSGHRVEDAGCRTLRRLGRSRHVAERRKPARRFERHEGAWYRRHLRDT
jgi:hypothetical protein